MIISGIVGIILGSIAILGAGFLSAVAEATEVDVNENLLIFSGVFAITSAVISLIAGILGVKNSSRPDKANICIVFGVLVILFYALDAILGFVGSRNFEPLKLVIGLLVPILYLVGAFQSKGMIKS
jgi:hypothetical protein